MLHSTVSVSIISIPRRHENLSQGHPLLLTEGCNVSVRHRQNCQHLLMAFSLCLTLTLPPSVRQGGCPWLKGGLPETTAIQNASRCGSFVPPLFLSNTHAAPQVAAVDEPQVHLWETGITRITRHPQNTGQLIWCLAHLLWVGNSFVLTTSAALVAHHFFACYHGDFRLERKHGKVCCFFHCNHCAKKHCCVACTGYCCCFMGHPVSLTGYLD